MQVRWKLQGFRFSGQLGFVTASQKEEEEQRPTTFKTEHNKFWKVIIWYQGSDGQGLNWIIEKSLILIFPYLQVRAAQNHLTGNKPLDFGDKRVYMECA